jgi:hypothetical protein
VPPTPASYTVTKPVADVLLSLAGSRYVDLSKARLADSLIPTITFTWRGVLLQAVRWSFVRDAPAVRTVPCYCHAWSGCIQNPPHLKLLAGCHLWTLDGVVQMAYIPNPQDNRGPAGDPLPVPITSYSLLAPIDQSLLLIKTSKPPAPQPSSLPNPAPVTSPSPKAGQPPTPQVDQTLGIQYQPPAPSPDAGLVAGSVVGAVIGGALVTARALLAVTRIIKRRGGNPTLQAPANKPSSSEASGWVVIDSYRYISSGGVSNTSGLFDGKAHISSQGLASTGTGSATNILSSYADSPRHAAAAHVIPSPSAASLGGIEVEVEDRTNAGNNASSPATIMAPCSNSDPQKLTAQMPASNHQQASNHQHSRPASYVLPASAAGLLHVQAPSQGVEQVYEALQQQDSIRDDNDGSPLEGSSVVSSASHTGTHGQTSAQGSSHSIPQKTRVQQLAAIEQELRSMCLSLHGSQRNTSNQAARHSPTDPPASATGTGSATKSQSKHSNQSSNSKGGSSQHNTGSDSAPVTCALGTATPLSSNTGDGSSSATTAATSPDLALVDHIPGLTLTSTLGSVSDA